MWPRPHATRRPHQMAESSTNILDVVPQELEKTMNPNPIRISQKVTKTLFTRVASESTIHVDFDITISRWMPTNMTKNKTILMSSKSAKIQQDVKLNTLSYVYIRDTLLLIKICSFTHSKPLIHLNHILTWVSTNSPKTRHFLPSINLYYEIFYLYQNYSSTKQNNIKDVHFYYFCYNQPICPFLLRLRNGERVFTSFPSFLLLTS